MTPSVYWNAEMFTWKARELVDISELKAPPVDPRVLARIQGIQRVVVSSRLDASGQLTREDGGLVIKLNAKEPIERQNFSCCHEIAHAFAFDGSPFKSRAAAEVFACSPSSPEEYWCDRAAAEMLMPEKLFAPLALDLSPGIASLVTLSRLFASSIMATIVRLGQVAVWQVVFIVWKFTLRFESSPKLRVFWSVRPSGYRCYIPRHATADPSSGIYATFVASQSTCEHESLDLGSLRGKYLVENGKFGEYVVSIIHDPRLRRA